jgi:hypothetical protein
MSAVGAAAATVTTREGAAPYSFAAGFFFAGFAAGALAFAARWRFLRALSFFWLMRRRIFMERRLSRLPMGLDLLGWRRRVN